MFDASPSVLVNVLPTLGFVTACYLAFSALGLAMGYALERWWPRKIWSVPLPPTQRAHELRGNVVFLVIAIAALTAALSLDVARLGEESVVRAALTFGALFFGFQIYYYALHRALHTHALVRFHRWHHESRVTTPLSGQSMSVVESLLWQVGYVAMPIAFSFIVPISLYGWLAYLMFNVVGNIVGHANVEVIAPSRILWWRSTLAAVFTFHSLHHARWTGHYGFESTWADRLFGTEWKDWPTLHRKIWSGQPLSSLKERGTAPSPAHDALSPAK